MTLLQRTSPQDGGLLPDRVQTLRSVLQDEIDRQAANENLRLPVDIDYTQVRGLSKEVQIKLTAQRPETLGQASRISGITPAAISLLLVHLKKGRLAEFVA